MDRTNLRKMIDEQIEPYEMDYYQYLPPANLMRLTATAAFSALRDYGYSYLDLREKLGATWMLGMTDMRIYRDIQIAKEKTDVSLYAGPLYRGPKVFMLRVYAAQGEDLVAQTNVCVMVVDFQERKIIDSDTVVRALDPPRNERLTYAPPRLILPEDMELAFEQEIRYYDCDRNQHLSAYRYAEYVCQAAGYWSPGGHRKADRLRIEYDKECRPGDVLSVYRREGDGGMYVKGVKQDGRLSFKAFFRMDHTEKAR